MRSLLKRVLLYPLLVASLVEADNGSNTPSLTPHSTKTTKSDILKEIGTCETGTINYITHTLPQQCTTSTRPTITSDNGSSPNHTPSQADSSTPIQIPTNVTHVTHVQSPSPSTQYSDAIPPTKSATTSVSSIIQDTSTTTVTTTSTIPSSSIILETAIESETDSPLDNVNFLSFEEWKKQNLAKAGQSPEHVGQHRVTDDMHKRTRPGINNALDVLGEDSEIELDFSGFGTASQSQGPYNDRSQQEDGTARSDAVALEKAASQPALRSKDAGKTCKERTNYASFDCAATVLKSNKECKSASSVLVENKDSYMLNVCSVKNKFFIVELCDDILIDTVVLANYEFFSSIFRTFRISVSDRYPVKAEKWRELGVYEARNTRDVQAFLVDQPLIWARYLRIEFLTHFGNEYYCPVSLLRVHGTTMMEEFRHQEEVARGDMPEDLTEAEDEDEEEDVPSATIAQEPMQESKTADESVVQVKDKIASATPDATRTTVPSGHASVAVESSTTASIPSQPSESVSDHSSNTSLQHGEQQPSHSTTTSPVASPILAAETTSSHSNATVSVEGPPVSSIAAQSAPSVPSRALQNGNNTVEVSPSVKSEISTGKSLPIKASNMQTQDQSKCHSQHSSETSQPPKSTHSSTDTTHPSDPHQKKSPPHSSSPAAPIPSTQESFFKSISKRLSTLESNATLSLQYIESQSIQLRSAFTAVEKRQITKTESFLSALNTTISAELGAFRRDYEQLWQSTVIELENQRRGYREENQRLERRLEGLADEVLWQKRMVVVQSTLLSLCLGLVIFARVGTGGDSVGAVWTRAAQGRGKGWMSPSAAWSPALSPVSAKRGQRASSPLWREGVVSDGDTYVDADTPAEETEEHESPPRAPRPELMFQPPTPRMASHERLPEEEEEVLDSLSEERELRPLPAPAAPTPVMGTQSSPSTPTGSRDLPILGSGSSVSGTDSDGDVRAPV